MTDATNGSATATVLDAGTPAGATGTDGANPGSQGAGSPTGGAVDHFSGLDAGTREWVEKAGVKDVPSLAAKAMNAEKLIGASIRVPGDDAKPEEWEKFFARLGRPDKPDGYEFKPPADMPSDLPYDQEFASWFKGAAHGAGLSTKAATTLHDSFVQMSVKHMQAAAAKQVTEATAALEKAWGPKGSPEYKAQVELGTRGIRALGGDELLSSLKTSGLLGPGGEVLDATVAKAFATAGRLLAKEGEMVNGSGTGGGPNPFADGSQNMTEQMRLIRNDPNRAQSLIRAAGKQTSDFGWHPS